VSWDRNGNFTTRQDLKQNVTETFVYDPLNRLDYSQRNGVTNLDVTLDAIGNITWKSDVGNFSYHATKRRAVVSAGSNSYGYDANGNMTTRNGSTISYTSYNLPTSIPSGANSSTLSYGAWRNTVKQVAVTSGTTETTIYVAGLLEKVTKGTTTEYRHRIEATPGTVAIYVRRSTGSNFTYYLHRDHLGSPEMITNASGNSVVKLSFSAYGERRDVDWDGPITSSHLTSAANVTRHGYTDHLHLDSVKLVHMGGRVYDPVIGRFLSRDPYIDGVDSSQGANGYAYVWNNPLTRWDPTGYSGVGIIYRIWCNSGDCYSSIDVLEEVVVTASRWIFEPLSRLGDINVGGIDAGAGGESGGGGSSGGGAGAPESSKEEEPQEPMPDDCTAVPSAPPGVDVKSNIEIARDHSALNPGSLFAFYQLVRNGGDWDYKQVGKVPNVPSPFEAFGNFNYGATGVAMGIPDQLLLRAAGAASMLAGTSPQDSGNPLWHAPYGDSPVDQAWIKQGVQYSRCMAGAGR
jgi:RHS repeat-associated protein